MKVSQYSGYVLFAVGVLLVTVLTSIRLTCPIDGGTGVITGAEGLKVTDVQAELLDFKVFDTGCQEIYSDFTYKVKVSLVNEATASTYGAMLVKFYHPSAVKGAADIATATKTRAEELEVPEEEITLTEEVGKGGVIITFTRHPVATKLIFVEMPAKTAKTIEETMQFQGFGLQEIAGIGSGDITHVLSIAPPGKNIVCPYSHGSGRVPLTEWLRIKAGV